MKTKIFVAITLIISALFVTSCSCKKIKEVDYKYVGAYIEVIKVEEKSIDDRNLKLYYDENKKVLVDINKIYEYQIVSGSLTKNIENNNYDISGAYSISIPNTEELKEVNVYPITYDGSKYNILDDKKTIKLVDNETNGVSFSTNYFFEKEEYTFKISIKIYKKETY